MIFDSNVVIDLIDGTGSADFMDRVAGLLVADTACINEVIFAEVASRYPSADRALAHMRRLSLQDCHRAGTAFARYRREGGTRTTILPDFLIGAHAAGQGWPIVTRDRKEFARYFPDVDLIDPYTESDRA